MTSTRATSARSCPVCGARNSGLSLFCAECGSALNGSPEFQSSGFGSTAETDSQPTQAFTPASRDALTADSDHRQTPRDTAFSQTRSPTQSTGSYPWTPGGSPAPGTPSVVFTSDQQGGNRGFVLGVVAMALIAILLALYVWAGVLSDSARDSINGWFDIIGGSGG